MSPLPSANADGKNVLLVIDGLPCVPAADSTTLRRHESIRREDSGHLPSPSFNKSDSSLGRQHSGKFTYDGNENVSEIQRSESKDGEGGGGGGGGGADISGYKSADFEILPSIQKLISYLMTNFNVDFLVRSGTGTLLVQPNSLRHHPPLFLLFCSFTGYQRRHLLL